MNPLVASRYVPTTSSPPSLSSNNPISSCGYYAAPNTTSVCVFIIFLAVVWMNVNCFHWLAHAVVLLKLMVLLCMHEVLRPFCCSFSEACRLFVRVVGVGTLTTYRFIRRRCKPQFPGWTFGYEVFQAIAFTAGEISGENIIKPGNAAVFQRNVACVGRVSAWVSSMKHGHHLHKFTHNGLEHLWIRPTKKYANTSNNVRNIVILYYHGGGYALFSPIVFVDYCNRIITELHEQFQTHEVHAEESVSVSILLANYRKILDHKFPVPLDDALVMYNYLIHTQKMSPDNIILAGDSAGGGMAMATLLRLNAAHQQLPLAVMLTCPFVDLSADVAKAKHCFITQSMLTAIREFCVSPHKDLTTWQEAVTVNADLTGLPSMFILAGEYDILLPQSLQLAQNAENCGIDVQLDLHPHMPHTFALFPESVLPQSKIAIANMATFIRKQLQRNRQPLAPAY